MSVASIEVIKRQYRIEVYPPDGSVREVEVSRPQQVSIVTVGIQGPAGPQGPAGAAEAYIHTQGSPSDEWVVNHNFGEKPIVEVLDSGGNAVNAQVLHISNNQLRVYFSSPQTGAVRAI